MNIIGIDAGTTTLSAVVLDGDTGKTLDRLTVPHGAFLPGQEWERIQDADKIASLAEEAVASLSARHPGAAVIGLTGQMHGILYTDKAGRAVSPLYTWQDGRGSLIAPDGRRFSDALSEETGCALATGYGSVTHAWLLENRALPENAARFCTLDAYIGMRLTGRTEPLLHASDAASIGLYDVCSGCFDERAAARFAPEYFPETTRTVFLLGETASGARVYTGVGDNQASFFGAMQGETDAVLVNIGTGSQVSVRTDGFVQCPGCETRPLDGDECLLVGAPLCGGRAYAMLERFLRECAAMAGCKPDSLYEKMNELATNAPANPLRVDTSFCGTRTNPDARGSISGVAEDNFTPAHLIHGVLTGMADELCGYYRAMTQATGRPASRLVASGNAVRLNPALQRILSDVFGLPLSLPECAEEAATGAAWLAMRADVLRSAPH